VPANAALSPSVRPSLCAANASSAVPARENKPLPSATTSTVPNDALPITFKVNLLSGWSAGLHSSPLLAAVTDPGGTGALVWTAFKVGALAFGGGFVIVPLMQADAVGTYHWMTHGQFLNAVALGQVTPGPVTQTVAAVGYSAGGLPAGLLAALVAFAPSFSFILFGAARFERLLLNDRVTAFLSGAAPAAAGAIIGSAVPLAGALGETWQYILLALATIALLVLHRGVVATLLAAGTVGAMAGLIGAPLPH
jgi:chromate transporter